MVVLYSWKLVKARVGWVGDDQPHCLHNLTILGMLCSSTYVCVCAHLTDMSIPGHYIVSKMCLYMLPRWSQHSIILNVFQSVHTVHQLDWASVTLSRLAERVTGPTRKGACMQVITPEWRPWIHAPRHIVTHTRAATYWAIKSQVIELHAKGLV